MPQGLQRLLVSVGGLTVRRLGKRPRAGLLPIPHRLLPQLPLGRVVRETLGVLAEPIRVDRLRGIDDPRMQGPPSFQEQAPVGDVVGQGVLEGVFEVRKEARLVQELSSLEVRESLAQAVFGYVRDGLHEREGHVLPNDGGRLEEALVLGGEPIDAGCEDRLCRRRDLQRLRLSRHPVGPSLPDEHLGLHEGLHGLFQEEGVALGPRDQHPLERSNGSVLAQQGIQQRVGAGGLQRVDPQLEVVGLPAPGVLVFGTVVDEEQDARRREALDQPVEQGLGLGIDPVEVLEDHE
jgi:hypothetical protein